MHPSPNCRIRPALLAACALLALAAPLASSLPAADSLHDAIRQTQRKVVKIYGAGGVRGLEAYQSGILISPEGHVLTVFSYVLDVDDLAVVLDDGRKYAAKVVGVDPVRELAVLKLPIEDERLPAFDLAAAQPAHVGDRVLALSNLFNIAGGDEPVSVLQGVVTALAPLDARRGGFQTNYHGTVYVLDAAANNPGAAGGALVNWHGELVGLLGKELRSRATGAWMHYALPIADIAETVVSLKAGRSIDKSDESSAAPLEPLSLAALGIVLVPDVLERTPPYIDAIFPKSPAAAGKLQPDDLIVFVEGEPTASCKAVVEAVRRREKFDEVRISVLRKGKLVEVPLSADDATESGDRK